MFHGYLCALLHAYSLRKFLANLYTLIYTRPYRTVLSYCVFIMKGDVFYYTVREWLPEQDLKRCIIIHDSLL